MCGICSVVASILHLEMKRKGSLWEILKFIYLCTDFVFLLAMYR